MRKIDTDTEEHIRRWPVYAARLLNRFVGWTDMYCSAGCGYPITGIFSHEIDKIDDVPVVVMLCSTGSECEAAAVKNPVDQAGHRYSEVRPWLVSLPRDVNQYRLHFSR